MKKSNIEMMIKGIDMIREALVSEMNSEDVVNVADAKEVTNKVVDIKEKMTKKDVNPKEDVKEEVVEEVIEEEEVEGTTKNLEVLNAMTLKELKELAKELGVAVRGSKSAIIGRIMEAQEQSTEIVEETVDNVDEDVEETEEELEVEDELETQLADYTVEELADLLASVGLSAKGKKQALIARVVKAVEDGVIAFEDEDEEEDNEVEESTDVEEETDLDIDLEEVLADLGMKDLKAICKALGIKVKLADKKPKLIEMIGEHEDVNAVVQVLVDMDLVEIPTDEIEEVEEDNEETVELEAEGSEERIKAVEDNFADLQESVENGETTMEEIDEFLNDYYENNKSELKKLKSMDDEDKATMFCWIQANLVDDEGNEVEFNEPYMVGDKPYCCGQPMKHVKGDTYVCEVDGEEIELED